MIDGRTCRSQAVRATRRAWSLGGSVIVGCPQHCLYATDLCGFAADGVVCIRGGRCARVRGDEAIVASGRGPGGRSKCVTV